MTGRPGHQQERCALMPAGSAGFASKRRTHRRSRGEQRDHGTAGIARRREPGLSFIHSARMVRAYGKYRIRANHKCVNGDKMRKWLLAGASALALSVAAGGAAHATVFSYTGAVASFTVATSGEYQIVAAGAQGGEVR